MVPLTAASIRNAPPRHPSTAAYPPPTNKTSQTTPNRAATTAIALGRSRSATPRMKHDPRDCQGTFPNAGRNRESRFSARHRT